MLVAELAGHHHQETGRFPKKGPGLEPIQMVVDVVGRLGAVERRDRVVVSAGNRYFTE